jgi:hypothetical protein
MADTSVIISFATGLGVGSILTAIVQHKLTRKAAKEDTTAKERKAAIEGFLAAYAALAEGWSDPKAKTLAHWEARMQLVCSSPVVVAVTRLKEAQPGTDERTQAHNAMMLAMRIDLGVTQ